MLTSEIIPEIIENHSEILDGNSCNELFQFDLDKPWNSYDIVMKRHLGTLFERAGGNAPSITPLSCVPDSVCRSKLKKILPK